MRHSALNCDCSKAKTRFGLEENPYTSPQPPTTVDCTGRQWTQWDLGSLKSSLQIAARAQEPKKL
jgi:hypothetical protein